MKNIEMLTSMAGQFHSFQPGEIVEVDDAIAEAWVGGGIAAYADPEKLARSKLKASQIDLDAAQKEIAQLLADNAALQEQIATLVAQFPPPDDQTTHADKD